MKPQLHFAVLLVYFLILWQPVSAQQTPATKHRLPHSAAAITETGDPALDLAILELYGVISGPAGQKRDWEKFKTMFASGAQMGIVFINKEGIATYKRITPDEYIASSGKYVEENGFFENEISRRTERFGQLVNVWSTYEARNKATDPKPAMRGINSIQFVKIGDQYRIASLIWQQETENLPLPAIYLPSAGR